MKELEKVLNGGVDAGESSTLTVEPRGEQTLMRIDPARDLSAD